MTRALVITGPVGVGKTTTAEAIGALLQASKVAHQVIDMDALRGVWPPPKDDPFDERLGLRNLADLWRNVAGRDLSVLVIADVIERPEDKTAYEAALPGVDVVVVRLDLERNELDRRLRSRAGDAELDWYLARADELSRMMQSRGVGDVVVRVQAADDAAAVADAVLAAVAD